jgi:histidinol-phosphate aminotransferase
MPYSIAELLNRVRQPFTTNTLAQIGAAAALGDTDFVKQTIELVHSGLTYLYDALDKMGLTYYPTQANFFLIDVERPAGEVFEAMLHKGIIVRAMTSYGFPEFIRINVGLPEENQRFVSALKEVL